MRLKEEASLGPLQIRSGVGLLRVPHTSDRTNEPPQELKRTQWLSIYKNLTASKVETTENIVKHHQHHHQLCFIINNNLDNAKTGCKVLTDSNSNHHEDDNMQVLPISHQWRSVNVPMEDIQSSPDDIGHYKIPSFVDTLPNEGTTSERDGDLSKCPRNRRGTGILNPNNPGFQRYTKRLYLAEERKAADPIINGNMNDYNVELNQLDGLTFDKSSIYAKSKLNIAEEIYALQDTRGIVDGLGREKDLNIMSEVHSLIVPMATSEKSTMDSVEIQEAKMKADVKMADAYLSRANEDINVVALLPKKLFGVEGKERGKLEEKYMETAEDNSPHKMEKMEINYSVRMATMVVHSQSASDLDPLRSAAKQAKQPMFPIRKAAPPGWLKVQVTRREGSSLRNASKRRLLPAVKDKWRTEILGSFDVYNIETAMPKIDLEAIESHLHAAKEEENRRRNDREEIRRRLAMDPDDYYGPLGERQGGRKPSLQSRLQSGMNLQICFMNETVSDGESPTDGSVILSSSLPSRLPSSTIHCSSTSTPALEAVLGGDPISAEEASNHSTSLSLKTKVTSRGAHSLEQPTGIAGRVVGRWDVLGSGGSAERCINWHVEDFFGRQARLQAEARMALAQAKEMAHMQMEVERQRQKVNSPITQMVRASLLKVGQVFPADRRRVSRQMLTEMNVAQLQVIVNDLHSQIEVLNEDLVKLLMERDDLHMEQDSMLVDIEDLTRYLGAKEKSLKECGVGRVPSMPLICRPKMSSLSKK